jgi:tetratricopeptide (TPR) repeat protein
VNAIIPSSALRRYLAIALAAVSLALAWQASELWIADHRMQAGTPAELQKSAALVPGNAEAWDRLGRYYLLNFSNPNVPLAITYFGRAVKVDPFSEDYWMDLASAYDAEGNEAGAQEAFAEARRAYPASAMVDWNYGNFLLREGRNAEAYDEIQRAVQGNPLLLNLALSRVWHATQDVNQLIEHVIPLDVHSYITALNFFGGIHQIQPGMAIWAKLISLKKPLNLSQTYDFFSELIREDDSSDALRMWNDAVVAAGVPDLAVRGDSLVSDGTFEGTFPQGGLGWQWGSQPGVTIDFDNSTPDGKGRSIRLDFNGGVNLSLNAPMQYVAVEPGRTYRFHAALRTSQITTESGIRVLIDDPVHGAVKVQTSNLTGTNGWSDANVAVNTGPQTHFLQVEVFRDPSRRFDNELSGSAWIADVSLVPAESTEGQSPQ